VHALDAEVAKARENAKPVVEDPYKVPRVISSDAHDQGHRSVEE
jgi:ribosome-binding factor A